MRFAIVVMAAFFCASAHAEVNMDRIAKDRWLEVRSENFIIITDAKEKIARSLVRDLENFRYFIHFMQKRQVIDSPPPLKIFAIQNARTFKALDLPEQWGGVFLKRIHEDIAIANITNFKLSQEKAGWGNQVLLHEYFHYASRTFFEASHYPLWYSEGEADYFGTFRFADRGKAVTIGTVSVVGARIYSLRDSRGRLKDIDVEDLFKTTQLGMAWRRNIESSKERRRASEEISEFYARAMFTYHYLSRSAEAIDMKSKYLTLINTGMDIDKAFALAFDMSWEELNEEIQDYLSSARVPGWRFKVGGDGIVFPEVAANVRELDRTEIIREAVGAMTRVGVYSDEEIDTLFAYAQENEAETLDLAIARIDWLFNSGEDISAAVASAEEQYGDDALVRVWSAVPEVSRVQALLAVEHPSAKNALGKLRNLNRGVLNEDKFNRLAYYNLGTITARTDEEDPKLLNEARIMLDSAKLLMSENWRQSILSSEMSLSTLMQEPDQLLMQKNLYATISDGEWITKGYGRFVKEMLELRRLGNSKGEVTDKTIHYAEGSKFEGELLNGTPQGPGSLTNYLGAQLNGNFVNGKIEGEGELKSSNGYRYVGEFHDGVIAGKGVLEFPGDREIKRQTGDYRMGQEHGYQEIEYRNGDVLTGYHRAGTKHGKFTFTKMGDAPIEREFYLGLMRYKVGDNLLYAGAFDEEYLPHNLGTCYYTDVNEVYRCRFEHGELKEVNKKSNLILTTN